MYKRTLVIISFLLVTFAINSNAQKIRSFSLKDLDQQMRSFEEIKGEKLTLIDFWATWCKPCTKSIPELNKIYEAYKDKGVQLIGINGDGPRSVSKVAPVSKALGISYPVLLDLDQSLMTELNLSAYPTLLLIDSSNKIVWRHEGYLPGDENTIKKELDKRL